MRAESSDVELAIPRSSIAQLWVVEGRKGNFWTGAGIGLLAGGLIGAGIGSTGEICIVWDCGPTTGLGVVIGAPAGFLLGGVVGLLIRSDRWEEVPLDRLQVSVVPQHDGLGIGVSVSFQEQVGRIGSVSNVMVNTCVLDHLDQAHPPVIIGRAYQPVLTFCGRGYVPDE